MGNPPLEVAPGQVHRHLITTILPEFLSCLRKLLQRIHFNMFTYFWCFLGLFIEKFIPNSNNEHAEDSLAPGQFLRSVHMEKSYLGKAGYPVLYNG